MNKKAVIEGAKEVLRLALFGAVGAVIAWLTELDQTTTVTVALFVLRYIDKYLHSSGKAAKGLSRF